MKAEWQVHWLPTVLLLCVWYLSCTQRFIIAEISDTSPRKLLIVIIYRKLFCWIKVSKNSLFHFEKGSTALKLWGLIPGCESLEPIGADCAPASLKMRSLPCSPIDSAQPPGTLDQLHIKQAYARETRWHKEWISNSSRHLAEKLD